MLHEDKTFRDQRVEMDGNQYVRCRFENCQMVYSGGQQPSLDACSFIEPRFTFAGAAGNTVAFMSNLYRGGFESIVEPTLQSIRGNPDVTLADRH